jgi:hypothetical protein
MTHTETIVSFCVYNSPCCKSVSYARIQSIIKKVKSPLESIGESIPIIPMLHFHRPAPNADQLEKAYILRR